MKLSNTLPLTSILLLQSVYAAIIPRSTQLAPLELVYESSGRLSKREEFLYLCTDENYGGTCAYVPFVTRVCYNLPDGPMQDSVTSIWVPSAFGCAVYEHWDCTGATRDVWDDTTNIGEELNDKMTSFWCWEWA